MSIISFQCYELRNTADELDEMAKAYKSGHNVLSPMLRDAADTILELRDDLQRATAAVQEAEHDGSMAWDRVRKAECENAKLRELFYETWDWMQRARYDRSIRVDEMDEIGAKAIKLGFPNYELGVEVK